MVLKRMKDLNFNDLLCYHGEAELSNFRLARLATMTHGRKPQKYIYQSLTYKQQQLLGIDTDD